MIKIDVDFDVLRARPDIATSCDRRSLLFYVFGNMKRAEDKTALENYCMLSDVLYNMGMPGNEIYEILKDHPWAGWIYGDEISFGVRDEDLMNNLDPVIELRFVVRENVFNKEV